MASITYRSDLDPDSALARINQIRTGKLVLALVGFVLFLAAMFAGTALMYNDAAGDDVPAEWRY